MRTRRMIFILFAGVLCLATLFAREKRKNFWDAPFTQWSGAEAKELYTYSPWAQKQIPTSVLGGGAMNGEQNLRYGWTARLLTALPIREAYVRVLQISNHYDAMAESQRAQFEQRTASFLAPNVGDQIIVGVEYATNDRDIGQKMKDFFSSATVTTLSPITSLESPHLGRLELVQYFKPDNQSFGARFVFARTKNGQPALQAGDSGLRFEFSPPKIEKLVANFEASKMMYKGKLEY